MYNKFVLIRFPRGANWTCDAGCSDIPGFGTEWD